MTEHLPRWVYASSCKHFDDRKGAVSLYFDRHDRDTDWAEFRLDGPIITRVNQNLWYVETIVNIVITAFLDEDLHKIYRMIGTVSAAYSPICVYRYGNGEYDDGTYVGSLCPNSKVDTINYGVIQPESRYQRSTVEASYKMILKGN